MGGSPILRPYPAKNCDFTFLVKISDVVCLAKVVCIPPCEMAVMILILRFLHPNFPITANTISLSPPVLLIMRCKTVGLFFVN